MGEEKEKMVRPDDDQTCDSHLAYNEDGVDLSHIRQFLALTPAERLRDAQAMAQFILRARALNHHA
jgi:hypothetical protein